MYKKYKNKSKWPLAVSKEPKVGEAIFNELGAEVYDQPKIKKAQAEITKRAIELLDLPKDGKPRFLLNLGCGTGMCGEMISESGHHWVGTDISRPMLKR
jgi:18S rRNA (guanine1575-N7)-methyltransferase